MARILQFAAARIGGLLATILVGGLLTAWLVRVSPGFDVDERELDSRLTADSRRAIEQQHRAGDNIWKFYAGEVRRVAHGDLGESPSLNRPITQLLQERLPVTAGMMAAGIAGGWALAFALAMPAALGRRSATRGFALFFNQLLLCCPGAGLALVVFDLGGPARLLPALVVCPRVFEYLRNLLTQAYAQPHILVARSKGLGEFRVWARHVMPSIGPQLLALAGVSVSLAFGAAIPIETLCDIPGVGQLAWKAATARDLPLIVAITFLVIAVTQASNSLSDWAGDAA